MNDQNLTPQPPEPPQPPQQDHDQHPNDSDVHDLKSAQNLVMVASFAGPISVFLGGILLSGAGLVCGFLGLRTLNELVKKHADHTRLGVAVTKIRRACIVALAICGIALILNVISFAIMYPIVLEALESGNYENLFSATQGSQNAPEESSTWG